MSRCLPCPRCGHTNDLHHTYVGHDGPVKSGVQLCCRCAQQIALFITNCGQINGWHACTYSWALYGRQRW